MNFWWNGVTIGLGKDFILEIGVLNRIKPLLSEPSLNIGLNICFHSKRDHCPQLGFLATILWWSLISISLYSVHHCDKSEETVLKLPCLYCGKENEFRVYLGQ